MESIIEFLKKIPKQVLITLALLLAIITPVVFGFIITLTILLSILFLLHKVINRIFTGIAKNIVLILLSIIVIPFTIAFVFAIKEGLSRTNVTLFNLNNAGIIIFIALVFIISFYKFRSIKNDSTTSTSPMNYIVAKTPNTNQNLISTIKGKHVCGLSTADNKSVEVFLYDDRLVFIDGAYKIKTLEFDDYIEVEARYKEAVVGSTTTASRGIGLASTVAALKGDWLAAIALSPNTTTYTTRPDIVSYWALWIESTGLYVIQIDSESKLRKFVDSCNAAIDAYQASQLPEEEPEEPLYNLTTNTSLPQQSQTQSTTKSAKISINKMTGIEFEEFCTKLLSKNGFINVIHTGGPNDQGADIVATKDGIKYAFQCKCYSSPLGNTPVQEALAGKQFRKCHIGIVITSSTFTKGAKELADSTQIVLWDNSKLRELLYNTDLKDKYSL